MWKSEKGTASAESLGQQETFVAAEESGGGHTGPQQMLTLWPFLREGRVPPGPVADVATRVESSLWVGSRRRLKLKTVGPGHEEQREGVKMEWVTPDCGLGVQKPGVQVTPG